MTVKITKVEPPNFLVNPYDYLTDFDDGYIAHIDTKIGFLLTRPFLDKIEILGDPQRTEKEEAQLYKLEELSSDSFPRITENKKNISAKSKYKKHYKVVLDKNGTQLDLFLENQDTKNSNSYNYRFMKLVFNPWKSGVSGIEKIRNFYNTILPSDDFDKMLMAEASIGSVDMAVDIIGIDIVDLAINTNSDYRLNIFQTKKGKISTAYTKNSTKKYTNLKLYDKHQEILDKATMIDDHRYGKLINSGFPITRIEKTRDFKQHQNKKNIKALTKTQNPFGIDVGWVEPKIKNVVFKGDKYNQMWRLFLLAVCHAGLGDGLAVLDEEDKNLFKCEFESRRRNIFEFYNDSANWRNEFKKSILKSGLLSECN